MLGLPPCPTSARLSEPGAEVGEARGHPPVAPGGPQARDDGTEVVAWREQVVALAAQTGGGCSEAAQQQRGHRVAGRAAHRAGRCAAGKQLIWPGDGWTAGRPLRAGQAAHLSGDHNST